MSEPMLQDLEFPLSGKLRWLWPRRIPLGCLSIYQQPDCKLLAIDPIGNTAFWLEEKRSAKKSGLQYADQNVLINWHARSIRLARSKIQASVAP